MITRAEKNKKIREKILYEENAKKIKKISKIAGIILGSLVLIILYGMYIGAKIVIVNEVKITNELIPSSFHGTKIIHISDILYNSLNNNDLIKIKNQINEINPDIVIFTGNIKNKYNLYKNDLEILKNFFSEINAKLSKYAVIGNNDDDSFNVVMENNFKILNNSKELLYFKDLSPIEIIGFNTNDISYDNISESNNYKICIFSNPDKIEEILEHTNCNLAMASSTLGGEIKLFGKPLFDNHKYNNDYYKIQETDFYISNGLGNLSNIRYFNHPSINFYRLTKY
ncbi:MAG: metallophosphoesterase [Bacilli bacterium]|nr:metallophosphoesterase [Bacilli bacterium]